MILDLIQNVALLVALAVGFQLLARRLIQRPLAYRLAAGVLFGAVSVTGMATPMHFSPGVIYDARSVILALAGLFGGPVTAAIAAVMAGAYRAYLGGEGTLPGILTVVEAAALGAALYLLRRRDERWVSWLSLWGFGLLVNVIMLALQLLLPDGQGWQVVRKIGPAVIVSYPLGFLLVAQAFLEGEKRRRAEYERARLQEQLSQSQKMESIGRLAGGVAHDFNNMLSIILGQTDMLLGRLGRDSDLRGGLGEIRKAAERSAALTGQLLAFARRQTVTPRVLDLNETVTSMLKMLHRLIGEDIDLRWRAGEGPSTVRVDPGQVDQVLANLLVNARDAIGPNIGRVTIETARAVFDADDCRIRPGAVPGDYVMLAVSDDGCGMDEATLARVFEPFFTTKGLREGTGLGLATVYGIIKQNGGFINVYSEPGQGTTFRMYLPVYTGPLAPTPPEPTPPVDAAAGGEETILLVEDEPAILTLSAQMLEHLGYRVLPALTPTEAIDLAGGHDGPIDLLITDVVMPEMNGRDLAGRLLASHPSMKHLFMSGYTANVIAHHGVLDEDVHFLQKPFSVISLAHSVRKALDAKA